MKRTIIVLLMFLMMVTMTNCDNNSEISQSEIKILTEDEYNDLKEKPIDELTEEEQIQVSNYEELTPKSKLPIEYLKYVEENYTEEDTDISDADMFVNNNINIVFFNNSQTIGILGDKSQRNMIEKEIMLVLDYYQNNSNTNIDNNFFDEMVESENNYIYKIYGDIEIRGLYSKEGYDIHISNNITSN